MRPVRTRLTAVEGIGTAGREERDACRLLTVARNVRQRLVADQPRCADGRRGGNVPATRSARSRDAGALALRRRFATRTERTRSTAASVGVAAAGFDASGGRSGTARRLSGRVQTDADMFARAVHALIGGAAVVVGAIGVGRAPGCRRGDDSGDARAATVRADVAVAEPDDGRAGAATRARRDEGARAAARRAAALRRRRRRRRGEERHAVALPVRRDFALPFADTDERTVADLSRRTGNLTTDGARAAAHGAAALRRGCRCGGRCRSR